MEGGNRSKQFREEKKNVKRKMRDEEMNHAKRILCPNANDAIDPFESSIEEDPLSPITPINSTPTIIRRDKQLPESIYDVSSIYLTYKEKTDRDYELRSRELDLQQETNALKAKELEESNALKTKELENAFHLRNKELDNQHAREMEMMSIMKEMRGFLQDMSKK